MKSQSLKNRVANLVREKRNSQPKIPSIKTPTKNRTLSVMNVCILSKESLRTFLAIIFSPLLSVIPSKTLYGEYEICQEEK